MYLKVKVLKGWLRITQSWSALFVFLKFKINGGLYDYNV